MANNMIVMLPLSARQLMLETILHMRESEDQLLKLYQNNIIPSLNDDAEDFQEATFQGYVPRLLDGRGWNEEIVEHDEFGLSPKAWYPPQEFRSTADQEPQHIYGYYIVQAESQRLLWAERFHHEIVYTMSNNGDVLTIRPSMLFR